MSLEHNTNPVDILDWLRAKHVRTGYSHSAYGAAAECVEQLLTRLAAVEAKAAGCVRALLPFAEYAGRVSELADDCNLIGNACPPVGGPLDTLACPLPTLGDCRTAARAVADNQTEALAVLAAAGAWADRWERFGAAGHLEPEAGQPLYDAVRKWRGK